MQQKVRQAEVHSLRNRGGEQINTETLDNASAQRDESSSNNHTTDEREGRKSVVCPFYICSITNTT